MTAYYNEVDPYAAQWLRNLVTAGHIAPGDVDERSIVDVRADDLRGYSQCHFFAGIGGWSLALRLAGWDDARSVWTGSCPCQPFSAAGQGKAADDERHLWPDWFRLIAACRPPVVLGEQVEAAIGWGWLDLVHADMGEEGYITRFAVLPAASVGTPHIRQRLWFVANNDQGRRPLERAAWLHDHGQFGNDTAGCGADGELGVAERARLEGHNGNGDDRHQPGRDGAVATGSIAATGWAGCDWLPCTDGKARPVEPGAFPLASGIPARVGRLRAYGNAIVPQVAAEFIKAACS
jgi:DNA (cytosine-5)-methyltransferase 1